MIDRLKPYPTMKDSGVPWLGQVPEHWEVLPNRAFFDEVKERDHPEEPMLSVTITRGVIRQRELLADSSKKDNSNQDKSAYKLVRPGDIAYNKMRAWQGAIGVSYYHGIVSPAYVVERPRKGTSSRYLHYLLRTPAFAREAERWSYGITSDMWSLRPEHFKMIYGCLPSLLDQTAIVRFLDYADRRIQRYIRAKEKLIALLEEQKQAIIHQAVTGQVDVRTGRPYPAYKLSGAEWLGEVPTHWTIRKLGQIAKVFNGATPSRARPVYWADGTVPWLNSSKVNEEVVVEPSELVTERALRECSISLAPSGAVVLGLIGQGRTRGMSALLGIDAAISQNLAAIVPGAILGGPFLHRLLTAFYNHVREMGRGGNQEALNCDLVSRMRLPIPPLLEQVEIAGSIESTLVKLRDSSEETMEGVSLVREYRTRLIADVVTGKLDVRAAAAALPEVDPLARGDVDDPLDPDVDSALENLESRTEVII